MKTQTTKSEETGLVALCNRGHFCTREASRSPLGNHSLNSGPASVPGSLQPCGSSFGKAAKLFALVFILGLALKGDWARLQAADEGAKSPRSELLESFQLATDAFAKQDFLVAEETFSRIARETPGSEVGLQCEYFAAIAAWNRDPSQPNLDSITAWLENAKTYQDVQGYLGKPIRAKGWPLWIEAAHLILVKEDLKHGDVGSAKRRLIQLTSGAVDTDSQDENSSGWGSNLAWPEPVGPSPHAWLELGMLYLNDTSSQDERSLSRAIDCFERVFESEKSPTPLVHSARYHAALAAVRLADENQALEYLAQLQNGSPGLDLRLQALLLERRIYQRSDSQRENLITRVDSDLIALVPLVLQTKLDRESSVSAAALYDLAISLAELKLDEESWAVFEWLAERFPTHPVAAEARVRLARQAADRLDWDKSLQWAREAIEHPCPAPWDAFAYYLMGQAQRHLGDRDLARNSLAHALSEAKPSEALEALVRIERVEINYLAEDWASLETDLVWLKEHAKNVQDPPEWLPTMELRHAELLASKTQWSEAEKIVSAICQNFPEWSKANEADYLLARCRIAKADFDNARELLDRIASKSSSKNESTLAARSLWMMGETYMMQRRYLDAVSCYQRVFAIPDQAYWHAACSYQIGQCAEFHQDRGAAIEWYEKIVNDYSEFPFAKSAKLRLEQLTTSSTQQAERIGSGTKR